MPTTMNNSIDSISSISAGDNLWAEALAEYVQARRDAEKSFQKDKIKFARELADYESDKSKAIMKWREEAAFALEKEKFEQEKAFQKKLFELEKAGLKLTQKEKDALRKKEQKDRKKEEEKQKREAKKAISQIVGEDIADQLKDAIESGANPLKAANDALKQLGPQMKDDFKDAVSDPEFKKNLQNNFINTGATFVNSAMQTVSGVYSKISARLQSSGESFEKINATMQLQLAASPFIKYTDMLAKVDELVDSGVAYNVEQRAFLASISDKIASTFDAFDSNLLRIIRIQQEDSTKQRLGMEARLTEFLNKNYQDTSYLSGAHDSVTEALTASIVQLGTAKGAEFEYNVQKWFGSLSALGMGDSTLTGLAGAINSLSTGDVDALAGSEYMNLIVMAANRAGISTGDLLTKGLNEKNVNDLIAQIVVYWSELANNTNQVVRNQYSKLFGLDMIDMTAIQNVTQKDLNTILKENLTYKGMRNELTEQLAKVALRMHPAEMLNNVWENFMTGMGLNIASNPLAATTWLINDFIKDATGGINIPSFGAFAMGTGFNFDIETDLNSLIQLGMVGMSTLGQVGKVVAGLGSLGGLNLSFWGDDQYTRHGQGLSAPITGVTASTSKTVYIGNSSSSDIYDQTLSKAYDEGGLTKLQGQAESDAEKAKKQMDELDANVKAILDILSAVSTGSALRVKVEDYGLTSSFGA